MFTTHVHVCINNYTHYSYCSCSSYSIHVQKCNTRVGFCAPFVVTCLNPYLFSRACIKSLTFSFRFPISLFSVPNVFRALQYSSRSVLKKWCFTILSKEQDNYLVLQTGGVISCGSTHFSLSLDHKKQLRFKLKNNCLITYICSSTDIILCIGFFCNLYWGNLPLVLKTLLMLLLLIFSRCPLSAPLPPPPATNVHVHENAPRSSIFHIIFINTLISCFIDHQCHLVTVVSLQYLAD